MIESSYRPRNKGDDYYGRGIYLVTIVMSGRERLLARFADGLSAAGLSAKDGREGLLRLTPLGEMVRQAWLGIPAKQAEHGNRVRVHACVCMPDHFHGVIEVVEPMDGWSLGDIMQAFKAWCTSRWQSFNGLSSSTSRPILVDWGRVPAWLREKALSHPTEGALLSNLSKRQRQEYYALVQRQQRPLFDDNYDDTICLNDRHREAMIAYVNDNPRRAVLRRLLPELMRRCLHVRIGERSFGAFGNLFLLRWANRVRVQCHRKHPSSGEPYETTEDYARQHEEWITAILGGQTVIETPGISRGEQLMKKECLERNYPLIHLQKEPIGPIWKPELSRFEACAKGSLLILAPWHLDEMGAVDGVPSDSDYSRFHNLNTLAAEICAFDGEALIMHE